MNITQPGHSVTPTDHLLRRLIYAPPTGSAFGWCRMRCTRCCGHRLDVVIIRSWCDIAFWEQWSAVETQVCGTQMLRTGVVLDQLLGTGAQSEPCATARLPPKGRS